MRVFFTLGILLFGCATFAGEAPEGCGLPIVYGASGKTLFVVPLETSPFRLLSWPIGADTAHRVALETAGRLLPAQSGTGEIAWLAAVDTSRLVSLFRLTRSGEVVRAGTVRTAGEPNAFSWATDGAGRAWILIATLNKNERRIEAFRRERSGWIQKGIARAEEIRTPRPSSTVRSAIVSGGWQFRARGSPQRISVNGNRDLAEIYPSGGAWIELRLADLTVLTSGDAGAHWRTIEPPWPPQTKFQWQPEVVDRSGDAPMLRWIAGGRVFVARFENGEWSIVLDAPTEQLHGLSGPAVTADGALIFIALCYRTRTGVPESFDTAVIRNGEVRRVTVTVGNPP